MSDGVDENPFVALHQCKRRIEQIRRTLESTKPYKEVGVLNFDYFQLKKEKKEVERAMMTIHKVTQPDIIA